MPSQITMAYAYWKQGRHDDEAIFDLYFRKTPFQGEFVIFAGVDEVLKHLAHFHFTEEDIDYLRCSDMIRSLPREAFPVL